MLIDELVVQEDSAGAALHSLTATVAARGWSAPRQSQAAGDRAEKPTLSSFSPSHHASNFLCVYLTKAAANSCMGPLTWWAPQKAMPTPTECKDLLKALFLKTAM